MKNMHPKHEVLQIKVALFYAVLTVMGVIGLLWFLRPATSEVEKRELTKFPTLTAESLWNGSFFSGLDTWYSDTYPLRELLIRGNQKVQSLYGNRDTQLINQGEVADEIPDPGEETPPPALPEEPEEELPDGTIKDTGEMAGSIYITDNCGYGLYYFVQSSVERYAAIVNRVYGELAGQTNVYCLTAPINSGVMLDQSILQSLGCSDQQQAIDYLYSRLESGIKPVRVTETLRRHNAEYIFFHTDHHWTQLGAYYAYCEFAVAKGIQPHTLEQFQTMEFGGFLGTYYSSSQSQALRDNPDTIAAYLPMGTNTMMMTMTNGATYEWSIVNDVSGYDSGSKYSCFSGADNPFSYVHNPQISDGSSCLIVKDSYANAFIPFLVDHYEHVYWIDFRYYQGKITDLVREKGIGDVIFLQNIYNTTSEAMVSQLKRLT